MILLILVSAVSMRAQQTTNSATATAVPRLVEFSGAVSNAPGVVGVTLTFGLYKDQNGGSPLWTEVQNVSLDDKGRYTAHLGATHAEGLPAELFGSGEPRWLGVQPEGQAEQPRVLLVSVPYALKAADAETIGGKPLSAFVLAGDTTGPGNDGLNYLNTAAISGRALSTLAPILGPRVTAGTAGYLGMFTNSTDLGNSVVFQAGSSIGVGTASPAATFHSVATAAPGAFFDVYSNSLAALPVVYRAARGTLLSPSALQTDDILGGLAVRGYGATAFTSGRGQVMFRAAESWTDTANGTYLQFTTTPIGGSMWLERMRIDPAGNVGIGGAPAFPLDVRTNVGATYARFGGSSNPLTLIANQPHVGFNLYFNGAYKYGSSGYAGYLAFNQLVAGGFSFATAPSGTLDNIATMTPRVVITNGGNLGIGTTSPAQLLDVAGNINSSGAISASGAVSSSSMTTGTMTASGAVSAASVTAAAISAVASTGYPLTASAARFSTSGASYHAMEAYSLGSSTTLGVYGEVSSTSGIAGKFQNDASGKAVSAVVAGTEVMSADQNGVHAGPAMTGTPYAYGTFDTSGNRLTGSSNITCPWDSSQSPARYDCSLAGATYSTSAFVVIVTPGENFVPRIGVVNTLSTISPTGFAVRIFDTSGNSVQSSFSVVVYKP